MVYVIFLKKNLIIKPYLLKKNDNFLNFNKKMCHEIIFHMSCRKKLGIIFGIF
jgi:hypothetical protein